jgi:hypothetical protein
MKRALSINEVLRIKNVVLPFEGEWEEAFGRPGRTGVWFIWGNSGNGKSSFAMQLCKELCKYGRVDYDSLEEGSGQSIKNSLLRHGMSAVSRRMHILTESVADLGERMSRYRSPDFYVIDSFQYANISYREYIELKEAHRNKLIIFISHAAGRGPLGRTAKSVMYDADLKIWIEGHRAFSKGRYIGASGTYDIWPEGAAKYWGEKSIE